MGSPSCAFGPVRVARARRGSGGALPHQPPHPFLRGPNPRDPQLRPGFSVPLAMKRRGFEHPANVGHQDVVRGSADRPAATTRRRGPCRLPPRIHTGAGAVPHAADPLHAIRPTGGDRLGATHRVDLRRAKGPPASSWSTFAYSNSVSISSSPILACSRRWSSSRASGARLFRPACVPRSQKLSPPVRRPRRRDPHRPRHGLEVLPAQQTHHYLTLAPGREPTPTAAPGGHAGRHRFLNVLPHLDTPPARTLSQSSVQENPRAQDWGTPSPSSYIHPRLELGVGVALVGPQTAARSSSSMASSWLLQHKHPGGPGFIARINSYEDTTRVRTQARPPGSGIARPQCHVLERGHDDDLRALRLDERGVGITIVGGEQPTKRGAG